MICRTIPGTLALGTLLLCGYISRTFAQDFDIELEGFQQVPAVSTTGSGHFLLSDEPPFLYELNYELETEITQAHIHFGQAGVNGGVMIWLCRNPAVISSPPAPAGTPECAGSSGAVFGEVTADSVVEIAAQGIEAGGGDQALAAIRAGVAYVNVHSDQFPGGAVRGQLGPGLAEDLIQELTEAFEGHTHIYFTGRGKGHNNTEATTSEPESEGEGE